MIKSKSNNQLSVLVIAASLLVVGYQASDAHGQDHSSSQPTATASTSDEVQAGPVTLRAALSHSLYNRSSPDRLILKVDLNAASAGPHKRRPLNLALVFDRSGSMAEEKKFEYSMRAAGMVFENLSEDDIVSLIAFNEVATVLSPAGLAVNKDFLRYRLRQFGPRGDTNLSAALLEAFAQIDSKSADGQLKRVIVLTDGLANRGVVDPEKLRKLVSAAHDRGIGVSTLGCGLKFSQEVLSDLANAGGGRYTYIRSGEQIPEAVAKELDGLLDVVAQNAKLEIRMEPGAAISRVYGRLIPDPVPSQSFELGDIRDGERGSFLLDLAPSAFADGSTVEVDVTITLDNPETGKRERHTARSSATFSKRSNQVRNSKNDGVLIYANILDAMEKAEEAIQGMDIARFREARSLFDRFYDAAHQYAIKSRDQQLLNQTFLLRHFMAELATTGDRAMIHGHEEARAQLKKDADYRRYLLEHHRQGNARQGDAPH